MVATDTARGGELVSAVRAEWSKLVSVRSTWWCLLGSVPLLTTWVGINGVALRAQLADGGPDVVAATAPQLSAEGLLYLGQYALVALATLVMAGEFATGSIRSTLQWNPVRHRVLLSKAIALAPVCFVAGVLLGLYGTFLADVSVGENGPPHSAGDTVAAALATGVYLAAVGFISVAVAVLVRSVAGTLAVLFFLLTLLPLGLRAGSADPTWLPSEAGSQLMTAATPGAAVVLVVWVVVAMGAGIAVFRSADP